MATSTLWTAVLPPMSAFSPGLSTLTFARAGSRAGHRPFGDNTTPGRTSSERRNRSAMRPVTFVTIEEVESGEWGIGGRAMTTQDVKDLQASST